MRRTASVAAVAVGLLAGLGDGLAVVLENPRSFPALGSVVAFLAGAVALGGGAGLLGGLALALLPRERRPGPALVAGAGAGLALFLALGVRLHVARFFGEPLLAPRQLFAFLALAAACALAGVVVGRAVRRRIATHAPGGRTGAVLLVAVGLAAALAWGLRPRPVVPPTAAAPPPGARDLLLLTLDTTRADHLSVYGYPRGTTPALDRLARRGLQWETAYAPIPLTNPSHASVLTGLLPRVHGVRNNGTALPDSIPTFVRGLARSGWRCGAFVSGIPLKAGLSGLAPGFAAYDDAFSPLERVHPMLTSLAGVRVANRLLPGDWIERRAPATVAAAIGWLEATPGPRFLWVHLFDPHSPWDAAGPLRRRFAVESPGWTANDRPVEGWPHADYDAEVRTADRAIGDLLRAWDAATDGRGSVIVVADHGEGLLQHGELTHGTQLFEEDVHVPCLWRVDDPRSGANRVLRRARSTAEIPDGVPWAAGLVPDPPARSASGPFLVETFAPEGRRDRSAVIAEDGGKLVVDRVTGEETAFDLSIDPGETTPVAATGKRWDTLRERLAGTPVGKADDLDPETIRRLRSLGYLH